MNLLYYIPHRLLNDPTVELAPVARSFLKMFNPWISLSDRTGVLDIPGVPLLNNSPVPERGRNVLTFEACSYNEIGKYPSPLLKTAVGTLILKV